MELAQTETDPLWRADLGLVAVFAELTGTEQAWKEAVKMLDVKQSKVVNEWTAEAREQGLSEGRSQGLSEGHSLGLSEGRSQGLSEGHSQGLSEGRSQGLSEGRVSAVCDILEARFGVLPGDLAAALRGQQDAETLRQWTLLAIRVSSLDQFRLDAGI